MESDNKIIPTKPNLIQSVFHPSMFNSANKTGNSTPDINQIMEQSPLHRTNQPAEKSMSPVETLTIDDTEEPWIEACGRKRQRNSPDGAVKQMQKQSKISKYWLSQQTPVSNSFGNLPVEETSDATSESQPKQAKPPPIFVDRVSDIRPLSKLLNECANNNFELKVLQNERVKIQPKTSEAYKTIIKHLEDRETEFFTYKLKQERNFKVFLKNMHPSFDAEDIKEALREMNHTVTNIWNVKQRVTQKPLHMFTIELLPKDNNKQIYDIKGLLNCRVIFEPPRPKRSIPQCSNCQQYGHTKAYCYRQPKCIKCAGNHKSSECSRKERSDSVKCVLCNGNHPANYKGCSVYKDLQKHKFPPLRNKTATQKEEIEAKKETKTSEQSKQTFRLPTTPIPSYASAVKNTETVKEDAPNEPLSDIKQVMEMLKQIVHQMSCLTNLIVNLMTNPPQNSIH